MNRRHPHNPTRNRFIFMTIAADITGQCGDCFKLLAACFYEPEKELFLEERLCHNLASLLAECHCREAAKAAAGLQAALEETGEDELKVEYARLFVGPFELIAPPYGSVYLEPNRRLMGDTTMAVRKAYRDSGLSLEVKEAPDHVALELEFMHYLWFKEAEAAAEEDSQRAREYAALQADFLRKYLGPWIPEFCEKIRQGTENRFYRALAGCLENFIDEIIPSLKRQTS